MQRFIFLSLILSSLGWPAQAADNSEQALLWLERMANGFRELNYHGTFAYEQGGKMESLRVVHAVYDGEEFERLQYLDGERREIIRRGEQLSCFQPGQKLVRFYQRQQNFKDSEQSALQRFYQIAVVGSGRIAGREVVDIDITPRDKHRLGYQLSLDQQTALLLKMNLLDASQAVLERFQFVEVGFDKAIPREFFAVENVDDDTKTPVMASRPVEYHWQMAWLPDGFKQSAPMDKNENHDMKTYTDGLAAFSVFVEPEGEAVHKQPQQLQRGATVAYSLAAGGSHRVTVVGEIPASTAQLVAESVEIVK